MAQSSGAERYGDWDRLAVWLRRKRQVGSVLNDIEEPAKKLAKAIKKRAITKMKSRDPMWASLAASTVAKKGHSQPFFETGNYIKSIQDEVSQVESSILIKVGPEEGITDDYYNYQYIGTQLEFGTSTIPARPLWRPLIQEVPNLPEFKALLESLYEDLQ